MVILFDCFKIVPGLFQIVPTLNLKHGTWEPGTFPLTQNTKLQTFFNTCLLFPNPSIPHSTTSPSFK